jgi:cyanophycinase
MLRAIILIGLLASVAYSQGSLLLVGGGSEEYNDWSDAPYRWLVTHAPNARILVLHYADTSTFFSGYLPWLSPCTVSNLAITSAAQANDSSVYRRILDHDGIFLRGGDQWLYVNTWRGTLTEEAIRQVFQRGGVVGGTSAGEAILGEIVFDAHFASVAPRTALRNPANAGITLSDDFLRLGEDFICDSHFYERGRLGRLPAFLAFYKEARQREIFGLGVDYNTALAIGPDGVGEVMGAGTVTMLRYTPQTQTRYVAGEQLSMTDLRFDQLTAGAKVAMATGIVSPPVSAAAYAPVAWEARTSTLILDGSNASSDWFSDSGSVRKLLATPGGMTDTIGIISSPSTPASASLVQATLSAWGATSRLLWINEAAKNDSIAAADIRGCRKFVLTGNNPDSLGIFLDSATKAGKAFAGCLNDHAPLLFLSDDMLVAGRQGVGQMYKHVYGAYYGYLTEVQGIGVVPGLQCVPRLYEASSYIDNRASAVFWSMVRSHLPYGLLIDNGTVAVIADGQLRVYGATPALLVDARRAEWGSLPEFHDPGKANPRQNGGIVGGRLHIIRPGASFDLVQPTDVRPSPVYHVAPDRGALLQCYPNPFNASTMIQYRVDGERSRRVRLTIHDLLGREVLLLLDEMRPAGTGSVRFDASRLASGVYYCRTAVGGYFETKALLLIR